MAKWKPLAEMTVLSTRYPRLEAPDKVSGKAKYTADMAFKGLLYGAILGSPHPAAKIVRIDASKAQRLPGVKAVLTDVHPTGTIRYAGEEVAAVAAISPDIARDALELIEVEYETRPFAADIDIAMQDGAPRVFANRSTLRDPNLRSHGDLEAGFAAAEVVLEREYRTQVQVHVPLEAHGSVARWEGDELILYDSTQAVHGVREGIAKNLGMPASKVRVICKHMGAGFGSKLQAGRYSAIAARLARAANAPVKLMLDRKLEFLGVGNRPNSIQKLKIGAKKDGTLVAMQSVSWGTAGIGTRAGVRHPMVYEVKNWRREHRDVFTNAGPARAFRAPGCPQTAFAMEQLLDELAEQLGMDPLDLRLKNDPNPTRHKEWRLGAEKIGWQRRRKTPGSDPGPVKRGLGLGASIWWPGGRATQAKMTIHPDGSVEIRCGTQDIGTGTRTYIASIAAEEFGIPMRHIRPLIGDSDFPYSGASGGSTTSPSVAPAIKNTAEKAKKQLMSLASAFFGLSEAELEWHRGSVRKRGVPAKN